MIRLIDSVSHHVLMIHDYTRFCLLMSLFLLWRYWSNVPIHTTEATEIHGDTENPPTTNALCCCGVSVFLWCQRETLPVPLWRKAALLLGAHLCQPPSDLLVVRISCGRLLHRADGQILLPKFPVAQAKQDPCVGVPGAQMNRSIELCCSVSDLAAMEQQHAMLQWVTADPSIPSLGVAKGR